MGSAAITAQLDTEFGETLVAAARGLDPLRARAVLARRFPEVDADLLLAATAQASLAAQAEPRFGDRAWRLLWTADGLAQASHPGIAKYRAQRMAALGVRSAADLTCGLGIDLLALADAGIDMVGVESDVNVAELARRNADRHSASRCLTSRGKTDALEPPIGTIDVRVGSCTDAATLASVAGADAWFIDPARRGQARRPDGSHIRLDDPEMWSPQWSWVRSLASRTAILVAKTAPGIDHRLVEDASAEWLSLDGQVREVTAWWGVGDVGARTAVIVAADGTQVARIPATGVSLAVSGLPEPGAWLLEPDPAIIRAHVVGEFGAIIGATLVDPKLAYLVLPDDSQWTTDGGTPAVATHQVAAQPCARRWQVAYAGAYQPAILRELCTDLGITRINITGRGRTLPTKRVVRDLRLPGGAGRAATLITMALGRQRRTAVVLGTTGDPE